MPYCIRKITPQAKRKLAIGDFDTKEEARQYLRGVLANYKAPYRRGQKVSEHCYRLNRDSITVHAIQNDGAVSGDQLQYEIVNIG